jgi:predicted alpha/beta superfamily hydrolase
MKRYVSVLVLLILASVDNSFSQNNGSGFCIGLKISMYSRALGEEREILIHLPGGYDKDSDRYSVLYVLDGEWHFPHAVSYVTYLSDMGMTPEMIIVAVTTTDRPRDFLPTHVDQVPESGGSDKFITFLEDELIPYVTEHYRASTKRIIFGESNAGLFGIYCLLKRPDLFDSYIIGSPTTGHDGFFINDLATNVFQDSDFPQKQLVLTHGSDENKWLLSQFSSFIKTLKQHSPKSLQYHIIELENERHGSPIALYEALKSLYKEE